MITGLKPNRTLTIGIVLSAFFVLIGASSCVAQSVVTGASNAQLDVIVVDHLGFLTLSKTALPHLQSLYRTGTVALISPGLARYPDPAGNQWATFTAGDVIDAKNDHFGLLQRQLLANGDSSSVEIIRFGDAGTPQHLLTLDNLLGAITTCPQHSGIILCSITPPQNPDGSWDQLTPLVIGPSLWMGSSLTSATTRTEGLVALRDLAPTILQLVGAPIPASMTGARVSSVFGPSGQVEGYQRRNASLLRMFTITQLGQRTIVPLSWFLGLSALLAVGGGAWVASGARSVNDRVVCGLLRVVMAAPLALLLAPCLSVNNVPSYMAALIAFDLTIAVIGSPASIMIATTAVVLIDCVSGSHLIAATVVSGFWLSGIRFYGIGNEYMGVLIGMSLVVPAILAQRLRKASSLGPAAIATALFFAAVVLILSYPGFGAKAGGAVTSIVTFSLAWTAVYLRRRPNFFGFLLASACGFGFVFVMSEAAARLHAPPSHIQSAVSAVHQGRLGYIKHVAIRKAKMAVKTVLTPGGIVALLGIVPLWIYWRRSALGARVEDFLVTRDELAGSLRAGGWGLLAALLFNDSGGVACLFFFGAMALALLHEMVEFECVSLRSTSVMSV